MFNDQTAATPTADPAFTGASGAISTEQLEELLVLSQAPVSLEDALAAEAASDAEDGEAGSAGPLTVGHLAAQYLRMVALFAGVGMVSAAVRHLSTDPKLYLGIAAGGAALFALASTVLEPRARRGGAAGLAAFAGASLVLGTGLGLLVGGILHFSAFPHTAAALVPAGVLLSLSGYVLRNGRELIGRELVPAVITVVGIVVWVGIGLGSVAKHLDPPKTPAGQADHGTTAGGEHGATAEHGAAAAGDGHGAAAGAEHGAAASGAGHGEAATDAHASGAAADATHDPAPAGDTPETANAADAHSAGAADSHGAGH